MGNRWFPQVLRLLWSHVPEPELRQESAGPQVDPNSLTAQISQSYLTPSKTHMTLTNG